VLPERGSRPSVQRVTIPLICSLVCVLSFLVGAFIFGE
jgi:hypothetical protein